MAALDITLSVAQREAIKDAASDRGSALMGSESSFYPIIVVVEDNPPAEPIFDVEYRKGFDIFDWAVSVPLLEYSEAGNWGGSRYLFWFGTRGAARHFAYFLTYNGIAASVVTGPGKAHN